MISTIASTSVLNGLLRQEFAALETYTQALKRLDRGPEAAVLREIASDHLHAAAQLRRHVIQLGGEPAIHSGGRSLWAQAVMEAAHAGTEWTALRELEDRGKRKLEQAVFQDEVNPEARLLIRFTLIPQQRDHLAALERASAMVGCRR
jgi:bacterioferritin (cytochrome b1)